MRRLATLGPLLAALALAPPAAALDDGLARTPPMGWNSWTYFGCDVDERTVRGVADAMVRSGMRDAGYRYVVLDDCWMGVDRDRDGSMVADPGRFPSGIPRLARYVHARGLKLGLYLDIGKRTCMGRAGMAGHEASDLRQVARWGADYLKLDFCHVPRSVRRDPARAYARIRRIAGVTGRRMLLSVCNWGVRRPWRWGPRAGHLWRTTGDIRPSWRSIMHNADRNQRLHRFAGPGGWNDPDALLAGVPGPTAREERTQMSLWAMMAAPLMASNDVRGMRPRTGRTLLNPEVIRLDQDRLGRQGRRVGRRSGLDYWARRLANGDRALLVVNRGRRRRRARLRLGAGRRYVVRDLWARRSRRAGPLLRPRVSGRGARLFTVRPGSG